MAMSRDGSRIVFLYGPDDQERFYTVGLVGGPSVLPPPPSKYEDPDYLPEGVGEPAMLVNDDGTRLFYIDSEIRDELYLLDLQGSLPTLHITSDPIFQPYIGVHVLPAMAQDTLTLAIGDPNLMDWFQAELTPAGGTVENLTQTGSATQPYVEGTLDPRNSTDSGATRFVVEQGASSMTLRALDLVAGTQSVLHSDLTSAPRIGGSFAGWADVAVPTQTGDRLYAAGAANPIAPLFSLPPGLELDPPASGPFYTTVWAELAGSTIGVSAFYLPDGTFLTGPVESDLVQLCPTVTGGTVVIGDPVRISGRKISI